MKKAGYLSLIFFLVFVLLLILVSGVYLFATIHHKTDSPAAKNSFTIVLDCGHGGPDGGAVAKDGTAEKDINLALGFALREILVQNGFRVVMTREGDYFICDDHTASLREQNVSDLHNRLKIAESYPNSIFISLHMNNFYDAKYFGSQLFYSPNHTNSKVLAESIRGRLIENVQQGNDRPLKVMDSSVYIIHKATMPALLLECGFMSNIPELEKFKTSDYRHKFAFDVFLGINDYLKQTGELHGKKR